ncbi:protein ACCELERATED CELL DEATH 6-like [Hordeum vulgare]|nr:protein ACCELERATED CELL DEATH 6-like [Hordeum vulgare]
MEGAGSPPIMIPTQGFFELATRGGSAQRRIAVSAARDVENGVGHQPIASLAPGALLKGVTPDGDTPLHVVAGNGDDKNFLDYAGIIYERDRGLLFAKNLKGSTPLHCAARAGNSKMASHLIDLAGREGADTKLKLLRMQNKLHETALHEAVRFEDGRILGQKERALLTAADPAGEEENKDDADGVLEERNKDAAGLAKEEKSIVKLLMRADPELANYPADGISPLYLAILLEKSTIVLTLHDMSGGNLSYSGAEGQNVLHISVLRDTVMVDFLVQWNKSLTTQTDNDGSTPLHFASSLCQEKVFRANPAALYQADKNGSFPIHVAASVDAIKFYHYECPDSVGLCDAKGRTLLHVAVKKSRMSIVSYICRTSSLAWILNMQDNEGNTALHLAIQAGSLRMFCSLFGNIGVNLNITNDHGKTPFDLSRNKIPRGLSYAENSERKINLALSSAGAKYGALHRDKRQETYIRLKPKDEDKESEILKNAAQALLVASVLIATVAFSATFALPGGYRADDHTNAL